MADRRTRAELVADLLATETELVQLQDEHEEALRAVQEEAVAHINRAKHMALQWQADAAFERRRATDYWTNRSIMLVLFQAFIIAWHLSELSRVYSAATGFGNPFYTGTPTNLEDGPTPLFRAIPTAFVNNTPTAQSTPIVQTCTTTICPGDLSFVQFRGPTDNQACFRVFNTTAEESYRHAAALAHPGLPGPKLIPAKAKPEYLRLQKKYHPDKAGKFGFSKEEATVIQQILTECWTLINNGYIDPKLSDVEWEGWQHQHGKAED